MNKPRYAFYKVRIINGEYEYTSYGVTTFNDPKEDMNEWGKEYLKDFYGGNSEYDEGTGYWEFFGGSVAVRMQSIREITKEEFEVLNKFI